MSFVEKQRIEVIRSLNDRFRRVEWRNLPAIVRAIEEHSIECICASVESFLRQEKAKIQYLGPRRFAVDHTEFLLAVDNANILIPDILAVALLPAAAHADTPAIDLQTHQVTVDGIGRYKKLEIILFPAIAHHAESISELSTAVLVTAYEWMKDYLLRSLKNVETEVGQALYRYLRQAFSSNPSIARRIWFGLVDKERGFYALDEQRVRETLIELNASSSLDTSKSLSHFLTSSVPFSETHCSAAIRENRCIDFDFRKSKYIREDSEFERSEEMVFGACACSVYPLEQEGHQFLVAVFPTALKDGVLPLLKEHKTQFQEVFRTQKTSVRRLCDDLQRQVGVSFWARLMGQFVGGILGIDPVR